MRVLRNASAALDDETVLALIDDDFWRGWSAEQRRYVVDLLHTVAAADPALRERLNAAHAAGDRAAWGALLAEAVGRRLKAGEN